MGPRPLLSFHGSGWGCTAGWCGFYWSPPPWGSGNRTEPGKGLGSLKLGAPLAGLTSQQVTPLTVLLGYGLASDARMIKPEKLGLSVPLNVVSSPLLCVASCNSSEAKVHCMLELQPSPFAVGCVVLLLAPLDILHSR